MIIYAVRIIIRIMRLGEIYGEECRQETGR